MKEHKIPVKRTQTFVDTEENRVFKPEDVQAKIAPTAQLFLEDMYT